jgi:hypothetical protein
MGILRFSRTILLTTTFLTPTTVEAEGALALLEGETDGFAIDAITYPPTVAVIDTGTPANDLSNVDFEASNLVQSGTSPKMVHHLSSPYVRWSPHNMFLNSGTPATQNVTLVVGFVYTVTVTGAGGGDITGSAGASGTATTGSPATFTATTTTGTFTLTGSLSTIQLNRGATATAYLATAGSIVIGIPQSYDTAAAQYGILVEPAATNFQLRSEQFNNAEWTAQNLSVGTDAAVSPDGSTTAESLTASNSNAVHNLYSNSGSRPVSGTYTHTTSLYVKDSTARYVQISAGTAPTDWVACAFDLQTGTAGTPEAGALATVSGATITAIGNGWYRLTVTGTTVGSGGQVNQTCHIVNSINPTRGSYSDVTWAAAGTEVAYFWGAQQENTSVATSYIPTLGSTVTRASDDISCLLSTTPHDATKGTLYTDAKTVGDLGGSIFSVHAQIDDGTNNDRVYQYQYSDFDAYFSVIDGGGVQADILALALASAGRHQLTGAWAANDFDGSADGVLGTPDVSGTLPTMTTLRIGRQAAGVTGNILLYRLVYVPRQVETEDGDLENWRYEA